MVLFEKLNSVIVQEYRKYRFESGSASIVKMRNKKDKVEADIYSNRYLLYYLYSRKPVCLTIT